MPALEHKCALYPHYYRRLAPHLHANGYRVFPAKPGTKQPAVKNWTRFCRQAPSLEQVLKWGASPIPYGILLACGCGNDGVCYGAVDLDEDDRERSAQLSALTKRILGDTPLVRIGRPNRRVLLYALSPSAATSRNLHDKVGLICDRRCVVLYGIHPQTGQPYTWEGPGPEDVPAWDLP